MTFRQEFELLLVTAGLHKEEAEEIVTLYVNDPIGDSMRDRMHHNVNDYPDVVLRIGWRAVCQVALKWVDKYKPEFHDRALFITAPGE